MCGIKSTTLVFPKKSLLTICEWLEVYMTFSKPANVFGEGTGLGSISSQGSWGTQVCNSKPIAKSWKLETGLMAFSEICRLHLMG